MRVAVICQVPHEAIKHGSDYGGCGIELRRAADEAGAGAGADGVR